MPMSKAFQPPPSLVSQPSGGVPALGSAVSLGQGGDVTNHLKVQLLVRAYQARGHHKAKIDPLGIRNEATLFTGGNPKELDLEHYQFKDSDMEEEFELGPGILPRFKTEKRQKMKLKEIIAACERLYSGSYGSEYIHIPYRSKRGLWRQGYCHWNAASWTSQCAVQRRPKTK